MQHIFFMKNMHGKTLEFGRMHENIFFWFFVFFVFYSFEMQFLCFLFFFVTHTPILFFHYFLGTLYNYIICTKKKQQFKTNTTSKITKTPPQQHCWKLKPRRSTGGASSQAPPPLAARGSTRRRRRKNATSQGGGSASSPPFLAGNSHDDLPKETHMQQHKQCFGFRSQICLFPFKSRVFCFLDGGWTAVVADLLARGCCRG